MLTTQPQPTAAPDETSTGGRTAVAPRFADGQQWHESLGCAPLSRILFTPLPGLATEADLVELADRHDRVCELVGGTMVERPASVPKGELLWRAVACLYMTAVGHQFLIRHTAAVMRLTSGNVRAPDIALISLDRLPGRVKPTSPVPGFVAEVLSADNTAAEVVLKLADYFAAGILVAWIIDPASKSVRVHYAPDHPERVVSVGDTLAGGQLFPSLSLPVVRLFEIGSHQED